MKKLRKSAFSLIELSIVLVIASIVLAGVISASTVSIRNAKIKITNERMAEIYKALGSFVVVNHRLPCPAALNAVKGVSGHAYGSSVGSAGSCFNTRISYFYQATVYKASQNNDIMYGMVPFAALGLPSDLGEDGFGNKLIYIVNKKFTVADYPSTTLGGFFSSYSESTTSITVGALQAESSNIIAGNAFALISFGSNGYGAFPAISATQNSSTSSDTYEAQNYLTSINGGTLNANFGVVAGNESNVNIIYNNPSSEVFDDIVFVKTRSQMVSDFNLMFLIPCPAESGYSTSYYGKLVYKDTLCATPSSVNPSKKCGPFGVWIEEQSCSVF